MSSDPHESAAWRTFGMLDADETAAFDEAMRHDLELKIANQEMERLAAAVAITATFPIAPKTGQLERLHLRLGIQAVKRANWLGITGWAAAAALTLILVVDRNWERDTNSIGQAKSHPTSRHQNSVMAPPLRVVAVEENRDFAGTREAVADSQLAANPQDSKAVIITKVETKRLIQEIEVLRGQLETAVERNRQRFESIPGMAWPIVMRMSPPKSVLKSPAMLVENLDISPITSLLGDALSSVQEAPLMANPMSLRAIPNSVPEVEPSAIPIYDAARDAGTLVVNNLPATTPEEAYNLWVTTKAGNKPVYVGRLPESNVLGGESFDFSLGSKAMEPAGFILTKDQQGSPPLPSASSIVLEGPR